MKEERDFAGFILPFAAGTYIITGSGFSHYAYASSVAPLSLGMTVVLLMALMHDGVRKKYCRYVRASIVLLGFCSGVFMGASSTICRISWTEPSIISNIEDLGHSMGEITDSTGFSGQSTSAVIKALITGNQDDIPKSVTEAFRDSGASHILSLSGFHLGIIYGIISWMLSWCGGSRRAKIIRSSIITGICGIYTLATGAGPSIVRSFIFILIGETGRLTHRKASTSAILLSALLIQLIINPQSIHSVSFQLSYAAMAGIAYIFPRMNALWKPAKENGRPQWPLLRKIWTSASMSISCQLTTGPLAYHYFGTFPIHFLLTNLIAIPLTTLIIPAALAVIILSSLDICPPFVMIATESLVTALIRSLEIIATM